MPKGIDLKDKSLIKALIQTKDWDKAIMKEYLEKHPEVRERAIKEKKSIEEVVGVVDLSYKWRNNLKYAQDDLTRLILLADTLPPDKQDQLFESKKTLDILKSFLGGHSTFMNEAARVGSELAQAELEFSDLVETYYAIRSGLPREQIPTFEKEATDMIVRPKGEELEALKRVIEKHKSDAAAWKKVTLSRKNVAEMAAAAAKECLDFCVQYYTLHIDDPAMQKVFANLFGDTKLQLDSILRQVDDKRAQISLIQALKKKSKEVKGIPQVQSPAAPRHVSKTQKSRNSKN